VTEDWLLNTDTRVEEQQKPKEEPVIESKPQSDPQLYLDLVGVMSHKVRTTLTAIVGYTEIILDGMLGEINAMQEPALRQVLKSSRETLDAINNILSSTKMETLKVEVLKGSRVLGEALAEFERDVILRALQKTGFNQTKAASLLGTTRRILHYRMDKLKITEESLAASKGGEEKR